MQLDDINLSRFYWIIGAMIVMNFGTIVTVVLSAVRAVWWISKLDSRVEQNRKDINAAHVKVRQMEKAQWGS